MGYVPELLIQYQSKDYGSGDFKELKYYKNGGDGDNCQLWVKLKEARIEQLLELRKLYPLAHFQYIFFKNMVIG